MKGALLILPVILWPLPARSYDNSVYVEWDGVSALNLTDITYEHRIGSVGIGIHPDLFNYAYQRINDNSSKNFVPVYDPSLNVSYYFHVYKTFVLKPEYGLGYSFNGNTLEVYEGSTTNAYGSYDIYEKVGNCVFQTLRLNGAFSFRRFTAGLYFGGLLYNSEASNLAKVALDIGAYSGVDF